MNDTPKTKAIQEKVPIDKKALLTIPEAAELTNIGQNKIRELIDGPTCPFVLRVGSKNLIKKERFLSFLENKSVI
ncbi:excisionase [Clostridium porci]|uniref:Helix-turn-helix domain-containing protein n=1 Tax=Clostridium porci TaxID=2605778 RepID=A0A7X2TDU8_9CLOT|nr:excisionase [Clostridium porci]MSS38317.1 helix-turn-helix domain-containing protein [Clostridium porci]